MIRKLLVATLVVVISASAASAFSFGQPPESTWSDWVLPYPYQRNILWDFETDPFGGPTSAGAPGAGYAGWDDSSLWGSDYVSGYDPDRVGTAPGFQSADYFESLDFGDDGTLSGGIGTDNRNGSAYACGWATFHIDNWADGAVKHLWCEMEYYESGSAGIVVNLGAAPGTNWQMPVFENADLGNGWHRWTFGMTYLPNPEWEEFTISFGTQPGGIVVLDDFHIATECVPEPATLSLLGLGLSGLVVAHRRRMRK